MPRQMGPGPVMTIAAKPGWELYAWRAKDGLCVSTYRFQPDRAFCVRAAELRGGPTFTCVCRQRNGSTLLIGLVEPVVRRAETTDRRGTAPLALYAASPALGTRYRFFRAVARSGAPPKWQVEFLDRHGNVVGSASQGFK